ncbi:MAG TPA: PCYCGC motif-containing (lipo)protein [Vicinamibacterales bacterium]|nr:PCYCGC motif-containing (lipo)protein [Vicinamibacterales bacterium]
MLRRILLPIGYLATTVAFVTVACSADSGNATEQIKTSPMTGQKANDPRYAGADLPLLPMGVDRAVRPLAVMQTSYKFAAEHPEVMKYVPCFCGCGRMGHKDNHDCFVTARNSANKVIGWETHALGCEICVDVAYESWQMFNTGQTVSAIRDAIEKKYADRASGHTDTPMPPRKGRGSQSHD